MVPFHAGHWRGFGTYSARDGGPWRVLGLLSLSTAASGIPRLNFKRIPLAVVLSLDWRGMKRGRKD